MGAARKPVLPVMVVCCVLVGWLVWSAVPALAAPSIEGESFSGVGSSYATLTAQVNPQGVRTSFYYEYATTSVVDSGSPERTPEVEVGEGESPVAASAQLNGLQAGVEYHFRLVARNVGGESEDGPEMVFRTFPASTPGLPDGRVYEMVTPPENDDADVYVPLVISEDT